MPTAATIKRQGLTVAGNVLRHVPVDAAQFFSFIASPSVRANPWPLYRRLHERGSVRSTKYGVWIVASHAGATAVLRHHDMSVDEDLAEGLPTGPGGDGPFSDLMSRTMLFTDPPDHARLRRLVSRAFTPRTIERLRPRIEALVAERLHELRPQGSADVLAELALPLPVAVICELFGLPAAERARFLRWARQIAPRLDISLFRDTERERLGDEGAAELVRLLGELIDDPTRRDPEGLISALVAVEEADDRLTRDEVIALCGLLLVAGFETTTNLIGNGLLALLRSPEQLARVRDGEVDATVAVEELLRFDGPVQLTQRVPLVDVTIDGRDIPARQLIAVLVGAANRDPLVFDAPDVLDVGRDPNPHLAFSSGIHHCLGAALARLEAEVALPALLRELPDLRLATKPQWRDTFVLRGLKSLPLTWR